MRRLSRLTLVFVLLVMASVCYSSDADNFFYTLGFRDGYSRGYVEGYRRAWMERGKRDRQILEIYKAQTKAVEAGKYLVKKGYVTAPEVYKVVMPDGSVLLKVRGCSIKQPAKLEEVIGSDVFVPTMLDVCTLCESAASYTGTVTAPEWKGTVVPGVASYDAVTREVSPVAVYRVEVKQEHLAVLDREKIPYVSVVEKGKEKYYAVFTDKTLLRAFCGKHAKVCGKVYVNQITTAPPGPFGGGKK